jgi:hypothetical protein
MADQLPRGLLADPAMQRAMLLPVARRTFTDPGDDITEELGGLEFAAPGLLYDPMMGMAQTGAMLMGDMPVNPDVVTQTMLDAPLVSGLLSAATGAAPKGAVLGANVFHGGPHRFAPEPDFPHGRPRLDKIGTGEGSQAFGWGFYSADSPRVAETYRKSLDNLAQTLDLKNPVDRSVGFLRFQHSKNEIKDQLKKEFGGSPEDLEGWYQAGKSKFENVGTLYKLDIPDADVAKYLDYDKPLSEQGEKVRDFAAHAFAREAGVNPSHKNYAAMVDTIRRQMDDTGKTGEDLYRALANAYGSDQAASETLRKAGIPGLKYFDQGSRAGGEGTRNYVTWDQDVLDRSKMLERDGVTLGANKGPTAALPGLLDDLPQYRTSDGYTFYQQKDGTLTDNADPEMSDMVFNSLDDLANDFGEMPLPVGKNEVAEKAATEFVEDFASFMDPSPEKLPDDVKIQRALNTQQRKKDIDLAANKAPAAALPGLLQDRSGNIDQRSLSSRTPRRRTSFPMRGLLGQRLYTATTPDGAI